MQTDGRDMIAPHDPRHPQSAAERVYIMEEFESELYSAASIGLESQNTTFVVKRSFGDGDLLDLYSDYVVEKVREYFRRQKEKTSAETGEDGE